MATSTEATERTADGRTRLVDAATHLIARHGHPAATVRRVAEAAGVSAPLVLHHFGSKQGLIEACDAHVRDVVDRAIAQVASGSNDSALQQAFADPEAAIALMYVGRALHDDAEMARAWFDDLYAMARAGMDDMERNGVMRPVADPTMTALLLLAMDLGMVVLRSHVERTLGAGLDDPGVIQRWVTAEVDLFAHALLPTTDVESAGGTDDSPTETP